RPARRASQLRRVGHHHGLGLSVGVEQANPVPDWAAAGSAVGAAPAGAVAAVTDVRPDAAEPRSGTADIPAGAFDVRSGAAEARGGAEAER
ncbi:hypothetical protein ACWEK7_31665, partial [Streptomyces californicus]